MLPSIFKSKPGEIVRKDPKFGMRSKPPLPCGVLHCLPESVDKKGRFPMSAPKTFVACAFIVAERTRENEKLEAISNGNPLDCL